MLLRVFVLLPFVATGGEGARPFDTPLGSASAAAPLPPTVGAAAPDDDAFGTAAMAAAAAPGLDVLLLLLLEVVGLRLLLLLSPGVPVLLHRWSDPTAALLDSVLPPTGLVGGRGAGSGGWPEGAGGELVCFGVAVAFVAAVVDGGAPRALGLGTACVRVATSLLTIVEGEAVFSWVCIAPVVGGAMGEGLGLALGDGAAAPPLQVLLGSDGVEVEGAVREPPRNTFVSPVAFETGGEGEGDGALVELLQRRGLAGDTDNSADDGARVLVAVVVVDAVVEAKESGRPCCDSSLFVAPVSPVQDGAGIGIGVARWAAAAEAALHHSGAAAAVLLAEGGGTAAAR
eukprot:gene8905-biopygen6415